MNIIHALFAITATLLIAWLSIAIYIVTGDMRERREWRRQDDLRRWRQTIDAYRRIAEQDK